MSESENNNEDIRANRLRIIELDTAVMNNKASVYQSRSMIEENRLMILSNYAAAFMGIDSWLITILSKYWRIETRFFDHF